MAFKDDWKRGRISEEFVLQYIRRRDPDAYIVEGKHSQYDINAPTLELTFEVKGDYESQRYNNIVVEVNHPIGKPSGLLVTTADYWVHDTGKELIWIKPEKIKDCIIKHNYPYKDFTGGDDRHAKRVYLVPIEVYRTFAYMYYDYEP